MADEVNNETADGSAFDDDFDWEAFFSEDDPEAPAATGESPAMSVPGDDAMRTMLERAQADAAKALEIAQATQVSSQIKLAIETWRSQATPAERALEPLLARSQNPDELKANAALVKEMAGSINQSFDSERKEMERKMQQEFGYPIPPTFQSSPRREQAQEQLAEGKIEDGINTIMKGFFSGA